MGDEHAGFVANPALSRGNAPTGVNNLSFARKLAGLLEHRTYKVDRHVDRRVGLPCQQYRVHRASHRRIKKRGDPAAMHGAERIVEALRWRGFEHHAPAFSLNYPNGNL